MVTTIHYIACLSETADRHMYDKGGVHWRSQNFAPGGGHGRVAYGFRSSWWQIHPELQKLINYMIVPRSDGRYWDFESDATPIFLSQNISDTNISVVPIFRLGKIKWKLFSGLWWLWWSNFELTRQKDKHSHRTNGCKICAHSQTPWGTYPSAPCLATPLNEMTAKTNQKI